MEYLIKKLGGVSSVNYVDEKIENSKSFIINTEQFFIPMEIDKADEKKRILKDLEYQKGFLKSVQSKLNNQKFVENAPTALIEKERKKLEDAETRIKILEENLGNLN